MSDDEKPKVILDLSGRQLKRLPKQEDAQNVHTLILDENELQKIDNIDAYTKVETLSLCKNQLLRMYGVCRLHCLRELNLSFNGILSIEGLKECMHLRHLNLEGNNIKTIEHLNNNNKLEYLNLAENNLGSISDISFLKNLKELYLHGNRLTHLKQCDKYLPMSLEILTLAKNSIADLNEICTLSNLNNLHSFTINDNPCVSMIATTDGFDHRPFVINWIMSVKAIDGFVVDPIESLKAEWLYSQGRGRQFRVGEQNALAKYLSTVCPLIGKALEHENERKLRLILCKAQQHQRQLQEEISENSSANNSPNSARKKSTSRIQSPRFSRLGRQGSPESMISSYHGHTSSDQSNASNHLQMTTSLIENMKNESADTTSISMTSNKSSSVNESSRNVTPNPYNDLSYINASNGPLAAATKMVPVPETLMSPDVCPASVARRVTVSVINTQMHMSKSSKNKDNKMNSPKMRSTHLSKNSTERSPVTSPRRLANVNKLNTDNCSGKTRLASSSMHVTAPEFASGAISSDDDSDHINIDKLRTIHNKAAQRCQQEKDVSETTARNELSTAETESSAVVIQKIWRGYRTRKKTKDIAEKLLRKRTYEYIDQLTKDMELTKTQLENERKIQQLQMQAISALWKKVTSMQECANIVVNEEGNSVSTISGERLQQTLSLDNNSTTLVNDLAKTCTMLTNQVQQLQGSMRDILNCLTIFCNLPQENVKRLLSAGINEALNNSESRDSIATQTEIVAVHTPQLEIQKSFLYSKTRPSTLQLAGEQKQMTQTEPAVLEGEHQTNVTAQLESESTKQLE